MASFLWSTTPVSGNIVVISASDWNRLTSYINTKRVSKGLPTIEFTNVVSGITSISATIFNQAISGFNGLTYSGTLPSLQSPNNSIYASYLIALQNCINSVV